MDSPGDDYLFVPDAAGDISRLTKACISTHRCIGEYGIDIYCSKLFLYSHLYQLSTPMAY